MKTIGNILWLVLAGASSALGWLVLAAILAISIVGLPFARQCLKMARFTLWPFGRQAVPSPNASRLGPVGNVIWFIPGFFLVLGYALSGALLALSIIGFPFAIQSFKFIPLALAPFGKEIVTTKSLRSERAAFAAAQASPPPAA